MKHWKFLGPAMALALTLSLTAVTAEAATSPAATPVSSQGGLEWG